MKKSFVDDNSESSIKTEFDRAIEEKCGIGIDVLSKYSDSHKSGLDFMLPCKKGQKLYLITTRAKFWVEETVCEDIVLEFDGDIPKIKVILPPSPWDVMRRKREFGPEHFGVAVFTSLEETVKVLIVRKKAIQEKLEERKRVSKQK